MPPFSISKLGRYEIVDELGKGAMGVVYLAKDPLIGRLVALKTFRVGFSAKDEELAQFRARFVREAQSAGILSHPNIVTIHDVVDEAESGICFIAMEYVRGSNLKAILKQPEPLPFEFVVSIVSQVAEALDFAHSRGVVHRDVKPANILITADNRVKITDFGIARLGSSNLTLEGQMLGTPNYMAPEQVQGRDVDHRADIFSLGVVLYEMLTRRKPFQGENLTAVTHRIVHEAFTPPEEYVRDLPPGVHAVLARALEKDPTRRYQSATELAGDLQAVLAHQVPLDDSSATQEVPPPPPAAERFGWGQRLAEAIAPHRRLVLALGLGLVALVALAAVGMWAWSERGGGATVAPTATPAADLVARDVARLVAEGRARLAAGDLAGATARIGEAEKLRPGDPAVALLRADTDRATAGLALGQRESVASAALAKGREALAARRWDDARAAAAEVLAVAPGHPEALEVQRLAEEGVARRERLRQARATPLATPEATPEPPAPEPTAAATVAPVATEATLAIEFRSEISEGIVTVYAGDKQILRESFRFFRKVSRFRTEKTPGGFTRRRTLPTGAVTLRVYVAIEGQAAKLAEVSGTLSGGERVLAVRVGPDGVLSANLR